MNPQYPFGQEQPSAPQPPLASSNYSSSQNNKTWMIVGIIAIFTTVVFAGLAIWALINYFDQKENVDGRVDTAVATAVKDQADKDAADYQEKEKQPNRQFSGPEDYGRLAFSYPKTWSVYVAKDASSGSTYEAYLNPVEVPPVSSSRQYALRVLIEDKDYEKVIDGYGSAVSRGDLTSSAVKSDGNNGTRLDGTFSKDIRGSAVIF
ncbi:hypothetical protein GW746_01685, partial [Candidatus Saccharibacteria bacterium]|nr:hypothetical protein [Candidatus Saccharibacteria bacterium]